MTKRERIAAALARKPVDRPPVAFWRHVPEVDHTAAGLAEAMLVFHRRWDLDLVKVMSSGVYCVEDWGCRVAYTGAPSGAKQCVEHAIRSVGDWARIQPLDPGAGALGRELEALALIVRGRPDDAPVLHTIFSPLTIARKLAGDRLMSDLGSEPDAVLHALDAVTETVIRYTGAALDAGADGIFFASQTASREVVTDDEHARFAAPSARRALGAVQGASAFTLLHLHGGDIRFDGMATLPVHAINWHDRLTAPSLAEGQKGFSGAVVGGLGEWDTLRRGSAAAVTAEVHDAVRQTAGVGVIVAPGCVLPLDVPDEALDAVVRAVRSARA